MLSKLILHKTYLEEIIIAPLPPESKHETVIDSLLTKTQGQQGKLHQLSTTEEEQIQKILEKTPESKINHYLKQAFPKQDLDVIQNKKLFAKRLLQELNRSETPQEKRDGRVLISTTMRMPNYSSNLSEIYAQQEVFAHFDTFGNFPNDKQIFIKWLNTDSKKFYFSLLKMCNLM